MSVEHKQLHKEIILIMDITPVLSKNYLEMKNFTSVAHFEILSHLKLWFTIEMFDFTTFTSDGISIFDRNDFIEKIANLNKL